MRSVFSVLKLALVAGVLAACFFAFPATATAGPFRKATPSCSSGSCQSVQSAPTPAGLSFAAPTPSAAPQFVPAGAPAAPAYYVQDQAGRLTAVYLPDTPAPPSFVFPAPSFAGNHRGHTVARTKLPTPFAAGCVCDSGCTCGPGVCPACPVSRKR